jgi:hypothetical protein
MALDFKQIPEPHKGTGEQDTFELFARDVVLDCLGFKIISGPGRGADAGRKGPGGITRIRLLVSYKHFAHSGRSVGSDDEPSLTDRMKQHDCSDCSGYIGFYSTLPSQALRTRIESLTSEGHIYDGREIEAKLLTDVRCHDLCRRYLPNSFANWKKENPKAVELFSDQAR